MKKLIAIFLVILMASCGRKVMNPTKDLCIISSIEANPDGTCEYYGYGDWSETNALFAFDFKFIDSCGKFQVGDTIRLTKK